MSSNKGLFNGATLEKIFIFFALILSSRASEFARSDIVLIVITFFVLFTHRNKISRGILAPSLFLLIFIVFNFLFFGEANISAYLRIFTRILLIYTLIRNVDNFWIILEKIIFFLVKASLALYVIQTFAFSFLINIATYIERLFSINIGAGVYSGIRSINIIIYTIHHTSFESNGLMRNSGFMWEPGAYAGLIIFAMIILFLEKNINGKNFTRYLTYTIALITTFSTMGYIGILLFFFVINLFVLRKRYLSFVFVFPVLLLIGSYIAALPFVKEKIISQYLTYDEVISNSYLYRGEGKVSLGRFGSFYGGILTLSRSPIMGLGLDDEQRLQSNYVEYQWTNGLIEYAIKFGILGLIILSFNYYRSFQIIAKYKYGNNLHLSLIFIMFLIFFSNPVTLFPIFLAPQLYYLIKRE